MKPLKALKPLGELKPLLPHKLPSSDLPPEASDNPEENARADHIAMMKGLRQQQEEANRQANSTGYYFCAYFQTEDQCRHFLKVVGTSGGGMFVDGLELAEKLGIELTERTTSYKTGALDTKCAALARKPGEQPPT